MSNETKKSKPAYRDIALTTAPETIAAHKAGQTKMAFFDIAIGVPPKPIVRAKK